MAEATFGALAGWRREPTEHGMMFKFQLVRSQAAYDAREFDVVVVTMNDRQLRSLARDLERSADERGIALHATRRRLPSWRGLIGHGKPGRA